MSEHTCEWCGTGTDGKKATCGSAHRGARWRWLKGISDDPPPWPGSPLHGRKGELAAANTPEPVVVEKIVEVEVVIERVVEKTVEISPPPGPRSGGNARSGAVVSAPRLVRATAGRFQITESEAAEFVRSLMSARQRAIFDRGREDAG